MTEHQHSVHTCDECQQVMFDAYANHECDHGDCQAGDSPAMPTEPHADDPAALVRVARIAHREVTGGCLCNGEYLHIRCASCRDHAPCLTAQLAEALHQEHQIALAQFRHLIDAQDERDAARSEAAGLRVEREKMRAALTILGDRGNWIERADGRLVWLPKDGSYPDGLARAALTLPSEPAP